MLYLLRHCQAMGQNEDAPLTESGHRKAESLIPILEQLQINKIYSSPMIRAVKTVEPFALSMYKEVITDKRLAERVLTTETLDSFLPELEKTFNDYDLKLQGGESSREAEQRAISLLNEIDLTENVLLVSHGNLIALILNYFEKFSFTDWKTLENPDLRVIKNDGSISKIELGDSYGD
ncbi:histidine phosphatase family protein [Staphylococcus sp. 18_1_E_LY]|uniref:Histidine phosphatase family protein n=2 Tax=Staphylococcus lloydii TaxID=2781774 RepID=A0A7T1FAK3_9STAP|nr:histidine phosphatase family protein [Staphylococcus lloydii]MBF7019684.1 histidine phosphatase family protein [Staphylococcus lloydii]MBF7027412.1 histidine phosphatase family protein [Staphylococcus lloydii]QPM76397.1 histidine phosphatase family protein [Staphylococcus lloydii]